MTENKTFGQLLEAQVTVPERVILGGTLLEPGNRSLADILRNIKLALNSEQSLVWEGLTQKEREAWRIGFPEHANIDPLIIEKSTYNEILIKTISALLNSAKKPLAILSMVEKGDIQSSLSLMYMYCAGYGKEVIESMKPGNLDKDAERLLIIGKILDKLLQVEIPDDEKKAYGEALKMASESAEHRKFEAEMWMRMAQKFKDVARQTGVKIEGRSHD